MKKKFLLISIIILLSIATISCVNTTEENGSNIIETFESILETLATIPIETILPTIAPTFPPETEPIIFDEDITFTYEYISNDNIMPYGLFIPSSASDGNPVPVIVWLHSMTERDCTESWFANASLPQVLNNWNLDGFNAYVICPHLYGVWNLWAWDNPHVAKNVIDILNKFSLEHNIDMDNIVIVGHSLGGLGAMYMPIEYPDYFSKAIVMSSLRLNSGDIKQINIPVLGCLEYMQNQFHFMNSEFKDVFGEESVWYYESNHGNLPYLAFTEDKDNNNRSDIIEWMFDDN